MIWNSVKILAPLLTEEMQTVIMDQGVEASLTRNFS